MSPISLPRRRLVLLGLSGLLGITAQGHAHPMRNSLAYGQHPRQTLDFRPPNRHAAPLVVFVHGGAWSMGDKRAGHELQITLAQAGFACACINYRLHPEVAPDAQASDVAQAVAWLISHAGELGIDPSRLALMGHSAGAHLAALAALDPAYLSGAGVASNAVRAVILLDGAGYDIERQVAEGDTARLYLKVFGTDRTRHRQLSPITYANRPAPAFLIHHVARRESSRLQAHALADKLRAAGNIAEVHAAQGESHASIMRGFGEPGDASTERSLAFLARHLG